MWELDYKESWALRNWCFWTVVLEKTLESSLNTRRSNKSILKEINPEHSLEGLMLKLNLQYFGHLISRTDSFEKTLMLGKIEGGSLKGMTEDEMVGWHHRLNGLELNFRFWWWTGMPVCCSPWSHKELDKTERLNCTVIITSKTLSPISC